MTALEKFLKDKKAELSDLRLKRREAKPNSSKVQYDRPIEELELLIRRFGKSVMEPRKAGHLIINYKLYQRFMKKLKGFKTKITIQENSLLLQYGKKTGTWSGSLELYDLSKYFEEYKNIPEAMISHETICF